MAGTDSVPATSRVSTGTCELPLSMVNFVKVVLAPAVVPVMAWLVVPTKVTATPLILKVPLLRTPPPICSA